VVLSFLFNVSLKNTNFSIEQSDHSRCNF